MNICRNCNTLFTWPLYSVDELNRYYDETIDGKEEKILDENFEAKRNMARTLFNCVAKFLPRGSDTLDIGTGLGEWLQLLHNKNLYGNYYGIDNSARMVKKALERCPWAHIYTSSAESMREILGPKKFDLITIISVIEHLRDPQKVVKYISDSLKIGGRTIIVYPRIDSYPSRLLREKWHLFSPVAHLTLYSKEGLSNSLNSNGLYIVNNMHLKQYYDLPYVLSYAHYFYPILSSLFTWLKKLDVVNKIKFRLYTGIDIMIAQKQSVINL